MTMMEIGDLADYAQRLYHSEDRLRRKEMTIADVRYSRHRIVIPPTMLDRAMVVRTKIAQNKLETAKYLLMDPEGLQVNVEPTGASQKAETERIRVNSWLQGMLSRLENAHFAEAHVVEDLLVRSRAWVKVMAMPEEWRDVPGLDLSRMTTFDLDQFEDQVREAQEDQRDFIMRKRPPFYFSWVPAESIIARENIYGDLAEVWEFTEQTVADVLEFFRDDDGDPIASELWDMKNENRISGQDTVTIVSRSDAKHMQIALVSLTMDRTPTFRQDALPQGAMEVILWEGEHGMGRVPYARFRGRESTSLDPVYRYQGFLDPVWEAQIALDYAITQLGSTVRATAWAGGYISRSAIDGVVPGSGDSPSTWVLREGAITNTLGVGEKIEVPDWLSEESWKLFDNYVTYLTTRINLHTIPDSAQGQGAAGTSGYMFAQLQAAAESVLEPWVRGLQRGWADVCSLLLSAANCLMKDGAPPIPTRYVTEEEGVRWIELPEELAEQEWEISVSVKTRQIGGEMAAVQALAAMKAQGWLSDLEAMRRLGFRNPVSELERIWVESVLKATPIMQQVTDAIMQRTMAALAHQKPQGLPTDGQLPQALASILQSPSAVARLPEGFQGGTPGTPQVSGGPNMAPPPPTLTEAQGVAVGNAAGAGGVPGGNPVGQAQASPGGVMRMSDILGLR